MNKKIIVAIVAVIVLIIGLLIYNLAIPKAYIQISVAPEKVTIKLNSSSRSVTNGDKIRVTPGDYKVVVSADGFASYSKDISLKNNQTAELLVALTPQTDSAKQLLLNDKSQAVMQRFYGEQESVASDKILKDYPIVSILPIQARLYSIAACQSQKYPNDNTKIALCITESQPDLDSYVLKDISSRGYDPNNYEIIWIRQYSIGE